MSETTSSVEYRLVPGLEGYRVGDDGSIWSCRGRCCVTDKWRQMKEKTDRYGYRCVTLRINRVRYYRTVHSLVLFSFVGTCPSGMQCRHLDGNPSNNRLSNLCWGTPLDNMRDRANHGHTRHGEKHYKAKLTEAQVRDIKSSTLSIATLATMYPVTPEMIGMIVRGQSWTHIK